MQIEKTLCDLGASVSLLPLTLCKKLEMLDLKRTTTIIQLVDRTIRRLVRILEDVPTQMSKFVIPCNFIIMDMAESSQVPIILGRLFLTAVEAVIDI